MAAGDDIPESWQAALDPALHAPETGELYRFLAAEEAGGKVIYPPRGQRMAALALTPLPAVRLVILGQDPYHGPGQAHGLAFSVGSTLRIPPSLRNIYKELQEDVGILPPTHGDLTAWARQGVLLLNSVLTVEAGRAGSHQNIGWEAITDAVVAAVAARPAPCVFLLWGNHAQKKAARIVGAGDARHLVLRAPHPSPLSAYQGFLGCRHFSQANRFLESQGQAPIDWALD